MRKRRKFYRGVVNHVYQRTIEGVHLFYTREDCLVFFTILSVCAKGADIQILELCLMHNHVHIIIKSETVQELSGFIDHFLSWFVHEYNTHVGRTGKLFKKNFGSAPKWEEKRLRSSIIYVGNNPVEKHFCEKALEYRWNFLAYRNSPNPFSAKIVKRQLSFEMRKALKIVDNMLALNLPLKYALLNNLMKRLSVNEVEQLTDYIVSSYSPIDYEELESHFKSFGSMIAAMDSTTGDDHDIKEPRDSFSIKSFREIMNYMEKKLPRCKIREVTVLKLDEKILLYRELLSHTTASCQQICNFLHIKTTKM